MAPLKFDDLAKSVTEVLSDDYQTSGFQIKAKQKTSWDGAVATTTVDLWPKEGATQTPAKISWKLPKPFGCTALAVDKFEIDKAGNFKLEVGADKALHKIDGLKLEVKHDLKTASKATVAGIYTGLKDTQIKLETAPLNLQSTSLEVTRAIDTVTVGLKVNAKNLAAPDLGVRLQYGEGVVAILAKQQLSIFSLLAAVQARKDLNIAGSYEHGGKSSGSFGLGVAYKLSDKASLKAKLQQDGSLLGTVKYDLSKGFTLLAGGNFSVNRGLSSYGLQLSIE